MKDVFPKFIIEKGSLIMGKVTYHRDLCNDIEQVKGGGWFKYDTRTKTFIFYGSSEQFGQASLKDIKKAIKNCKIYSNKYKTHNPFMLQNKYAYQTLSGEIIPLKYERPKKTL